MSREPKGFFVSLPTTRYQRLAHTENDTKGISFQLKSDGVRYFFVATDSTRRTVRDISTQFRSLTRAGYGHLWIGDEPTRMVHDRLREHAQQFYPDYAVLTDKHQDPYPWVAFPMIGAAMKRSGLAAPLGVNLQVASGLRAFTVKDMTERIFGESPKQLQAAVAESLVKGRTFVNLDNLTLASLLRGYLPPNELADILRMDLPSEGMIQQIDKVSANNIRLLLRRFKPHRLLRLMQSLSTDTRGDMLLRDSANQYAAVRKHHPTVVMDLSRQFRSFEELHQTVSREYRKFAFANVEIRYSDELTADLESIELPDGAKLIWPSWTHDLMDWASDTAMSNCIYSYGQAASAGQCLLLAVLDPSGKMVINIMIRGKNVIQCYGKSNQRVTDEALLEEVFNGLIDADIINPENDYTIWAGSRRHLELY